MGFLKRIGSIFGFIKDDAHGGDEEEDDHRAAERLPRRPSKGFSVQVPVTVDKPYLGPIILPCNIGEGGVQGFRWYGRQLRIDEDGDVADEFFDEVLPSGNSRAQEQIMASHKFVVKHNTRPAPVRKQIIALNGNIHPIMEYQGMLRWV